MLSEVYRDLQTRLRVARATTSKWHWRARSVYDRIRGYSGLKKIYASRIGQPLDLENPRTFTEKIQWRKVHDHREIWREFSDKARFRAYLSRELGEDTARRLLVPRLFEVARVRDIPFDRLPPQYVMKASHGSSMNLFVRGPDSPPRREIMRIGRVFLATEYGSLHYGHETAYRGQRARLIGEPLLVNRDGTAPRDVKFHMFDGRCGVIHHLNYGVTQGYATPKPGAKVFLSPSWDLLEIRARTDPGGPLPPKPDALEEMLAIAERLSAGIDYIRIDFITVDELFYLGEATVYPNAGFKPFEPPSADEWIGSHWVLPHSGRHPGAAQRKTGMSDPA